MQAFWFVLQLKIHYVYMYLINIIVKYNYQLLVVFLKQVYNVKE